MGQEETQTSSPGRPRTFDVDHVIDVAVESYWSDGVEVVSVNEICRRAGVSKPGLYREFGSEDGLMDAALARYAKTVLAPNFESSSGDLPFADVLSAAIELMVDTDRSGPLGCLHAEMRQVSDKLGPLTRKRVLDLRDQARATYVTWVERAKETGEVSDMVQTDVAVALIDFQLTNVMVQMALGEDPELLRAQARLSFAGLTTFASD